MTSEQDGATDQPGLLAVGKLPRPALALGVLTAAVLVAVVAYLGFTKYPDFSQPTGARAEARIARVFGVPENADAELIGDIAIERFYVVEPATGKRFIADMCKGRVQQVIETEKVDGTLSYSVLLDRRDLQLSQIRDLVAKIAPPDREGTYLGVQMQGGTTDVFPVNYSGILARNRAGFKGPYGDDPYKFLLRFKSTDIGPGVVIFTNDDNNYILNSTRLFPYFTTLFNLKDAVFISRLEFVDATSDGTDLAVPRPDPTLSP